MQVSGASIRTTVRDIYTREGVAAFWKGLLFAYGREWSYTAIKLGAYTPVRDALVSARDTTATTADASFGTKLLAGAITGGIGSAVGNPFDVMKTLAQTNNKAKAVSTVSLVRQMYTDQGLSGFYRGLQANVARACVLNATQMGVYDVTKGYITKMSTSTKFTNLRFRKLD